MRIRLFQRAKYRPRKRLWLPSAVSITGIRPVSDVLTTGWVGTPGAPLYANIDELTANDGDFNTSPSITATATPCVHALSGAPLATGTWIIDVRASISGGTANLIVRLYDNTGAQVGVSSAQAVTTTPTSYSLNVTTSAPAYRVGYEFVTP